MSKVNRWLAGALLCGALMLEGAGAASALGGRKRDCGPPQTIVLSVCHPGTGCMHDVPVCIPGCVVGVPCVQFERTCIGCGKAVYEWPCGHRVIVRYQNGGGVRVLQRD